MSHFPPFTIAPWELPPDSNVPLTAPADFVFRSLWQHGLINNPRETEIHLRVVPYKDAFLHYFCDAERSKNGSWVLSHHTHLPFMDSPWNFSELEHLFRTDGDLWYENIARLIYFDGTPYGFPAPLRATISPTASCLLSASTATFDEEENRKCAGFDLPFKNHRSPARPTTTRNFLLSVLDDESSKGKFALEWLHLTREQQRMKVLRFERGDAAQMKALLRAVLQSQTDIWHNDEPLLWRTRYGNYDQNGIPGSQEDDLLFAHHPFDLSAPELPHRLKQWKHIIWSYFGPSLNAEFFKWARSLDPSSRIFAGLGAFSVESAPPTAHESMEAHRRLRDWWHEKFPALSFDSENSQP